MFELSDHEVWMLIQGILQSAKYEELVIDLSGEMTGRMIMLMKDYADRIVYVSDGSLAENGKYERCCKVVGVIEQRKECKILQKTCLLYNRLSPNNSVQLEKTAVSVIGGIYRFEGISGRKLSEKLSQIVKDFSNSCILFLLVRLLVEMKLAR